MGAKRLLALACLIFISIASPAWSAGKRPLSDAELDQVTAGAGSAQANVANGVVNFQFQSDASSRQNVQAKGTLSVRRENEGERENGININVGNLGTLNLSSLVLRDNAQSNLRALFNINAVNSRIQVLMNLTVIINSKIDRLEQRNSGHF